MFSPLLRCRSCATSDNLTFSGHTIIDVLIVVFNFLREKLQASAVVREALASMMSLLYRLFLMSLKSLSTTLKYHLRPVF